MTAYEKICAEACELCAKGLPLASSLRLHWPDGEDTSKIVPCTAPTRDEVIERLTAELAEARKERDVALADLANGGTLAGIPVGLRDSLDLVMPQAAMLQREVTALTRQREEALGILTKARCEGMVWEDGQPGARTAEQVAAALSPARTAELAALKAKLVVSETCNVYFGGYQAEPIRCALPLGHPIKWDGSTGTHVGFASDGALIAFGGKSDAAEVAALKLEQDAIESNLDAANEELKKIALLTGREWESLLSPEAVTQYVAALKLERDELRADKERLDWIFAVLHEHGTDGLAKHLLPIFMDYCIYNRTSLDAARAAGQGKADA